MKRYIAVVAVWVAAAALFAAINVQAKPGEVVTPNVVGMTVAEAIQAWADAGFTKVPSVNPGNLDPASVPDAIVVRQSPNAGEPQSAGFHGAIFVEDTEPAPPESPDSGPANGGQGGTDDVDSAPAGDVEAETSGGSAGDAGGDAGSLSFTL